MIASGGIAEVSDLVTLAEAAAAGANIEGSIVGKALYAGRFTLPEALAAVPLALALYHVALLFGIGVLASVSPLIAHELGRGGSNGATVRRVVQQGVWAAACSPWRSTPCSTGP